MQTWLLQGMVGEKVLLSVGGQAQPCAYGRGQTERDQQTEPSHQEERWESERGREERGGANRGPEAKYAKRESKRTKKACSQNGWVIQEKRDRGAGK